jgi:hypothetical protein
MKKRRRQRTAEKYEVVKLWTYPQANGALPYLHSIASSLREHWLEAQGKSRQVERLHQKPGRVDKKTLLEIENAKKEYDHADGRFQEALEEMLAMHVFPIDVNQGLAFIPFRQKEDLAWFVFDLFESKGLQNWRFHNDPLETRRPINEVVEGTTNEEVII